MGIKIGFSRCSIEESPSSFTPSANNKNLGNPNPENFTILDEFITSMGVAAKIKYPDCANYEGTKILVFWKCSLEQWQAHKKGPIDPHFCEGHLSPFARFEPTKEGWQAAKNFLDHLTDMEKIKNWKPK